jgi:carbamoyl-phosphate synthase large subunit
VAVAGRLARAGLDLVATAGTASALAAAGLPVRRVRKISEGSPHVGDLIGAGEVAIVVNTPRGGHGARSDGFRIRAAAIRAGIPCVTTIEAAEAVASALATARPARPRALQDAGRALGPAGAFRPAPPVPSG